MARGKRPKEESAKDDLERSLEEADTRDVFDKALDYAPGVGASAGVLLGGVGALRAIAGPKTMRAFKKIKRGEKLSAEDIALLNRADALSLPAALGGSAIGGVAGGKIGEGAQARFSRERRRK